MPILRRSDAEISVELDPPGMQYYPGDIVRANVVLQGRQDLSIRQFRAELLFWEEYAEEHLDDDGETWTRVDEAVAEEVLTAEETITAGARQVYRASWQIPADAAPPYAGSFIRSGWLVRAALDLGRRKEIVQQAKVPLIVPPPGDRAQPGDHGEASHPSVAAMRLWLPRLEWVEGETVDGRLTVTAREALNVHGIRIRLLRREEVHAPRFRKSSREQLAIAHVAGKTRFQPEQTSEHAIRLTIPELGCPTRHTNHTTVTHRLEAALARRLRKDCTLSTEIYLYNGPSPG